MDKIIKVFKDVYYIKPSIVRDLRDPSIRFFKLYDTRNKRLVQDLSNMSYYKKVSPKVFYMSSVIMNDEYVSTFVAPLLICLMIHHIKRYNKV